MARRKIGAKRHASKRRVSGHKRRRRIGAISGGGSIMDAAMVIGGAIAAREASNVVSKQFPGTSLAVIGAGQVAVGYFLPHFVKKPWAKNLGLGMMAMGGTQLVVSAGLISGTGNRMSYQLKKGGDKRLSGGTTYLQAINGGTTHLNTVAGVARNIPNTLDAKVEKYFATKV